MSDFNSWEEVRSWLEDPEDNYQTVSYGEWTWSNSYMTCYSEDCCCAEDYETINHAIEVIKDYSNNRLHLVNKNV